VERGYSVVTVRCRDRPKLLFDVTCTLHNMDYVVFHNTVGTAVRQVFYIHHADGSPIRTEAESRRVSQCLQAVIERRSLEVKNPFTIPQNLLLYTVFSNGSNALDFCMCTRRETGAVHTMCHANIPG
jgi:hypothetical protein